MDFEDDVYWSNGDSDDDHQDYDYGDSDEDYLDYVYGRLRSGADQPGFRAPQENGDTNFIVTDENGFFIDKDIRSPDELQKMVREHRESDRTKRCTKEMTARFADLFNDRSSTDIILSVNGIPYHTHRLILSLWSTVFSKMLEDSQWLASSLTRDEDSDCDVLHLVESEEDSQVFNGFLKFFYTEEATFNIEDIWQVVSLANKYNVVELLNSCSDFLIRYVHTIPLDEELIEIMKVAHFWTMDDLHREVWQIILSNMYFSLETFLNILGVGTLCEALESSDLFVENEYKLLLKLVPFLNKLVEANDEATLQKVVGLIRFTEMSGAQLERVAQLDIAKHIRPNITEALFHRGYLWECEVTTNSTGPRCYLSPPPPYFDTKNKIHHHSFEEEVAVDWETFRTLCVDTEDTTSKRTMTGTCQCFAYHTERKILRLVFCTSLEREISVLVKEDKITIDIESKSQNRNLQNVIEAIATVTAVVHNKAKDCIHAVKATKVPMEIDVDKGMSFKQQIFSISLNCVKSESERYFSLFVMARL